MEPAAGYDRAPGMIVTVLLILAVVAFALTIASITGHCPLWAPVLIISLIELLERLPLGR